MADPKEIQHSQDMEESHTEYMLHRILAEIRWLQQNQTPPVNYLVVIIVSMLSSGLVAWLFSH